ncbi:hypothetical protein TOPH_08925 [Tolypocladium ophioglossoides CBS 100239]|uniref:Uncharacterized protein n=1 Tax=Tolypocladium ophioglossoides (strain CBS 100239) TaxID=1163406 RepID=A0A0L0MYA4_TOLOC|nr:hypothetical protein TOPH_08925 [Tolypocladium ophioglossoides CBS 100239]
MPYREMRSPVCSPSASYQVSPLGCSRCQATLTPTHCIHTPPLEAELPVSTYEVKEAVSGAAVLQESPCLRREKMDEASSITTPLQTRQSYPFELEDPSTQNPDAMRSHEEERIIISCCSVGRAVVPHHPSTTLTPNWALQDFATHPITSNESVFRQEPSSTVEAPWDRVADLGVITLTHEQVVRLGKNPSTVVKAPADWGVGDDAYLGQIDGIHLLHFLGSMSKSLYYNYPHYHPRGHSAAYRVHLSHCQEALAQWPMCQPSLELITFNWVEKHEAPFPDFDITRKCWDFEQLLAWQDEHRVQSINGVMWKALRIPDGAVPNPSPLLNEETLNQTWVNDEGSSLKEARDATTSSLGIWNYLGAGCRI